MKTYTFIYVANLFELIIKKSFLNQLPGDHFSKMRLSSYSIQVAQDSRD